MPTTEADPLFTPIETRRLRLRAWRDDDAEAVFANLSDRTVTRYTGSIPVDYERPMADAFIAGARARIAEQHWDLAIADKENDGPLGTVSLMKSPTRDGVYSVGYWLGVPHWGKGMVTEAVDGILGFAFRDVGLPFVIAEVMPENAASRRVMAKCGFTEEETHDVFRSGHGDTVQMIIHRLTREAWEARQ